MTPMEVVRPLERADERSPLAAVRLHRKLTAEEAARRASLTPEQVTWLEEGRVYRFPSPDHALLALMLYATALGVDHREARAVAGLPVAPPPPKSARGRLATAGGAAVALIVVLLVTVWPGLDLGGSSRHAPTVNLPARWKIAVDVLNGSGDINYTRRVASRIGGFGYRIERVAKANRFDYPETAVYYEPGGEKIGTRLADQLGVTSKPLPGGTNPMRLVVVVGQACGP